MDHGDELVLRCEDAFARGIEEAMRRTLYQWRHFQGDMVVDGHINSFPALHDTGTGISEDVDVVKTDERSGVVSRHFNVQIRNEGDLEKIRMPVVTLDEEATENTFRLLSGIFDGILPVKKRGVTCTSVAPWDELVRLTGVDEVLTDMVLRPDFIHKAIGRMTDAHLARLDQYEALNVLALNNDNCWLGGGLQYTDELPSPGFDPGRVRPKDMWGRTMSQIFSAVSPAMHDEFALHYELRYLSRFGLTYYGCCEPLHRKIGILRKVPNLRKISMSPWVDAAEGAEAIGRDYVYSMKANPAFLAQDPWNPEAVRNDLEENLRITRDCPVEVILKDISTVRYQPERLWEWARIASDVAA